MKYVALLRGINVGGVTIKMADLKELLEKAGFKDVKTLLASGNAVFDAPKGDAQKLAKKIEAGLERKYKRDIGVIVLAIDDVRKLDSQKPFKGVDVTAATRRYVTFLFEKPRAHLKLASSASFYITKATDAAVCSVLVLKPGVSSIDLMDSLGKHYGKMVTTRNWNTVEKILKAA